MVTEWESYGLSNFVADLGSNLGMMLGASLLTLFDAGVIVLKKFFGNDLQYLIL